VSLFVDTSGFYALLVRTERDHGAILEAFRAAAERGRRMVTTTNYVIVETSALLQHRIGLALLATWKSESCRS
jgi:predicted nucleic acid-binding protein